MASEGADADASGERGRGDNSDAMRYARDLLVDVKEERALADTKASLLLAVIGVVASLGASAIFGGAWSPSMLSPFTAVLWWFGNAGLIGAVLMLASAVYPRTSLGAFVADSGKVSYFGDIRHLPDVGSLRAAITQSTNDELGQLSRQLLRTSRLTARKFLLIRVALWTLLGSLGAYLGSVAVYTW